mmetsp:Transcript_1459/g.3260  ORF Transcript_1459/g.3260 Transcript_1459/m.3260 type:complete len:559 (+) Transcript_1459:245-1921(+)
MPFSDTFQNLPVCSADENQPLLWDQRQGSSSDLAIGYGYPVTEDIDDNVVDHVPDQEEAVIWTDMTLLEAVSESAEEWQHAVADIAEERRDASNDMTYPTLTPFAAYTASSLSPSSSVLSVTALPVGTVDNEDDTDDINTEKADDEDYEVQIKKIVDKDDETAAVASPPLSAYLLLAAAVVGLSSIGPFLNLQSDVDPMIKIVWRNISTAVALFPLALWETFKQPPRLTWPQIMLLLLTGAAYAGLTVCFSWSLAYTSVGNTTLLGNSQALVFLIGKVVMGQPIGRLEGAGALVAFGGLYLCSSSTAGTGNDDDGDDDDYSTLETVTTRGGGVLPSSRRGVDLGAVAKYVVGIGTQVTLIMGLFKAMDAGVARLSFPIPFWANVVFFYALHTKTGTFNPLSQRSQPKDQKFVRPRWTPPGWVFAVMWPLFVFGIRAVTAAMMVAAAGGRYAIPTLLWLHLHLSFGNLWNSINRVDQRLGASVPALYGLLVTNLVASYRFYLVRPIAGKLLAATSIWLAAAAVLETHAWLINPDPTTGQPEPLYPAKDTKWKTKFRWEA